MVVTIKNAVSKWNLHLILPFMGLMAGKSVIYQYFSGALFGLGGNV
jgi:hypothetical protein